jgi:hypothetical protein
MATDMPALPVPGRRTGADGTSMEVFGSMAPHGRGRWTAAHAEAARFLGECIGVGAVLGMVAAMRPRRGK